MDRAMIANARLAKAEEAVREAERELGTMSPEARARYAHCLQEIERARRFASRPVHGEWDRDREGLFG